jgi:amino acid adenylation domain-containing protein
VETLFADAVTVVPPEVAENGRALAASLGVAPRAVLLAAHARVVSALTGDADVVFGYRPAADLPPLPCRLVVAGQTWSALIAQAQRALDELALVDAASAATLLAELGEPDHSFRYILDLAADPHPAGQGSATTWVRVSPHPDGPRLSVACRGESTPPDLIAGYHVTAVRAATEMPEDPAGRASVVSPEEIRFQIEGLAGQTRHLPDRRYHELFEERVRAEPDRLAAVHGDTHWTYAELNRHANQLGRALLARGLRREDVVAVVVERDLCWMAAVIAIFKAGGVYLPIEPHFPPGRIEAMLTRSRCRFVLTRADARTNLDAAVQADGAGPDDVEVITVEAALGEGHDAADLNVPVDAGQLAYIYFTSGSTGEPKGAMCEHAGMLNHLYAKVDDLGIDANQVVAQTAPQCFDISLWQLIAATLVGGHTIIVAQDDILDVSRFVDTIVGRGVTVAQLVPSYLEVVLAHAEQAAPESAVSLGRLRCVSATGEELKRALVARWFARFPDITLVNAYGLTETSDDTNHEVMTAVPEGRSIPLGRPVRNVAVYVVDESLVPVPLGAPGEIVFSGLCVGRGYVNDPDRTRQAFVPDPHRPGQRLYRSGDYGRWRGDGKLEFLGRRDAQVKIRGFRIEIGEIENHLVREEGVRDAVVVVAEAAGQRRLVAFYTAPVPVEVGVLRAALAGSLPQYMVPSQFHWRESLPLTPNGKTDRTALTRLAAQLGEHDAATSATGYAAPQTPTEQRLARAWAQVLGMEPDRIGRADHFFEIGGTSLAAVRLVLSIDRQVSLRDVVTFPVLADLARLIETGRERSVPGMEGR